MFRKKDPPILTMEEMVESVHAVEALSQLLAKDKQTADVSIDTADKNTVGEPQYRLWPGLLNTADCVKDYIIPLDTTSHCLSP